MSQIVSHVLVGSILHLILGHVLGAICSGSAGQKNASGALRLKTVLSSRLLDQGCTTRGPDPAPESVICSPRSTEGNVRSQGDGNWKVGGQ